MTQDADLDSLAEPFKAAAYRLVAQIERDGLPFRVFETRRTFTRTMDLYRQGRELKSGVWVKVGKTVSNARPGESPHNWGLAIDCVLIPKEHDWWLEETPATGPWDDGRTNPLVKLAWERYGRCVRACGLSWGGDFVSLRDLPHAELRTWRAERPKDWMSVAAGAIKTGL